MAPAASSLFPERRIRPSRPQGRNKIRKSGRSLLRGEVAAREVRLPDGVEIVTLPPNATEESMGSPHQLRASVLDLPAEELAELGFSVDRMLQYLQQREIDLRERNFDPEDRLYWNLVQTELAVRQLSQAIHHGADPANHQEPAPVAVRQMTAWEFLAVNRYVVASCHVDQGQGAVMSYQVATAVDTPCPVPFDTPGIRIARNLWFGGTSDRADHAGRLFADGGVVLRPDRDLWVSVRTRAARLGPVDELPGVVPVQQWRKGEDCS